MARRGSVLGTVNRLVREMKRPATTNQNTQDNKKLPLKRQKNFISNNEQKK